MIALIRELAARLGTTFFVTEHDMKVVFGLARRIFVLHQGALLAQGTPEEIKADLAVREAYLGATP
jgi:branched-chain amino acid transport system ATP-binding protein